MSCKFAQIPGHVECLPKHMLYSSKQHLFLVVFELIGTTGSLHEVIIYWEPTDIQSSNNKGSLIKGFSFSLFLQLLKSFFSELDSVVSILGRDAALLGTNENQYAILDEDRSGLALFVLPGPAFQEVSENNGAVGVNSSNGQHGPDRGSQHFVFETEVDRIFSFPLG